MFGIKRLFGRKTEDNRSSSVELARQRCAQAEAKFFHRVEPEMRLAKVASLDIRSETVT
jgi:hypothetical protein